MQTRKSGSADEKKGRETKGPGPLALDAADRARWAKFSAQYLKAIPENRIHARAREDAAVLRAVKTNCLELFGVRYTARAKPQRVLEALEKIGETRSAAREALLRLAPDVALPGSEAPEIAVRGAPPIQLKSARATLDALFSGYPAHNREATLALLGASSVETPGELRALLHGPKRREPFVHKLEELLGDDRDQRQERFLYLLDALGIPMGQGSARAFKGFEEARKKAQKDRIERDIWGLWFGRDARVVAVLFLDYVDRPTGEDRVPLRIPGTVVFQDAAYAFVRLDGESSDALQANIAVAEAAHEAKLYVPFRQIYAFAYKSGCWSVVRATLPDSLGPLAEGAFDSPEGFLSLTRDKLQNLVDLRPVGARVVLQVSEGDRETEPASETGPEPAIVTESVPIAAEPKHIGVFPDNKPCARARTLRGALANLHLAIDPEYSTPNDYSLARDDMYRRFPVLATNLPDKHPTYYLHLLPEPAVLLREFRERAPPEVAVADVLWQFVETFM